MVLDNRFFLASFFFFSFSCFLSCASLTKSGELADDFNSAQNTLLDGDICVSSELACATDDLRDGETGEPIERLALDRNVFCATTDAVAADAIRFQCVRMLLLFKNNFSDPNGFFFLTVAVLLMIAQLF